ncbi:MAG: hypothetical protein ACFFCF_12565 [Promethearchaeota archaeon]
MSEKPNLSWEEREELDQIRSHVLRFRWLADGCQTWDDVIRAIQEQIDFIETLDTQNAQIIQNDSDYLFYTVPGEFGVYALYEGTEGENWIFRLPDGRKIIYPIDSEFDALDHRPIGTRIAVLLDSEERIQSFHVSFHQPQT